MQNVSIGWFSGMKINLKLKSPKILYILPTQYLNKYHRIYEKQRLLVCVSSFHYDNTFYNLYACMENLYNEIS